MHRVIPQRCAVRKEENTNIPFPPPQSSRLHHQASTMAVGEKSPPQNGVLAEKEEFTSEEVEDTFRHDLEVHGFSKQETKKLLRKIDWVLLPFLALLYL